MNTGVSFTATIKIGNSCSRNHASLLLIFGITGIRQIYNNNKVASRVEAKATKLFWFLFFPVFVPIQTTQLLFLKILK